MTDDRYSPRPSELEEATRARLAELFASTPIPRDVILDHVELYMRPQRFAEVLALNALYSRILGVHGAVMEFGVRWGRHLSVFSALRATYEPTNFYRKIVGFDTFAGFSGVDAADGDAPRVFPGSMAVSDGYETHLEEVLHLHEQEAAMNHIRRFELCKGDAPFELERYLGEHPETIVALAYFDMDIYRPTRDCLELLLPHVGRGSIIAFDEPMHPDFPGEAIALKEVLGLEERVIERLSFCPYPAFVVM
jgi:hypothetical protein